MCHSIFNADYQRWLGGALDDAGGENADDAAVPSVAVDDEEPGGCEAGIAGES